MPLPKSTRAEEIKQRYWGDPKAWAGLARLEEIGRSHGKTTLQTALAWLLSQPVITAPIIGANTAGQLKEILDSCGFRLRADEMETVASCDNADWIFALPVSASLRRKRFRRNGMNLALPWE